MSNHILEHTSASDNAGIVIEMQMALISRELCMVCASIPEEAGTSLPLFLIKWLGKGDPGWWTGLQDMLESTGYHAQALVKL